jgi:coenzyme F420 biosynthesis associated uncharacterized protein
LATSTEDMVRAATVTRGVSKSMGAGLVAGAAVGLLWLAAKRYGRDRAGEIIDWGQVSAIARRTSQAAPWADVHHRDETEADYTAMLCEIAAPLQEYTGSALDLTKSEVRALDRSEWISANINNFRDLLRPVEELYREKVTPSRMDMPGVAAAGRAVLSAEMGVLLGYLARRVLGQYDISLLGARSSDAGTLYFVEPNIRAVQAQFGLPEREFRLWLALHEATHVHEFEGFPWVREYLNTTVQEYIDSMVAHLRKGGGSMMSMLERTLDHLSVGGSLLEGIMTPEQRELVGRLQSIMCLLEGYSTHVMNALGAQMLPHFAEIEERVEDRARRRSAAELLFLKVTGLQMKMDQYRLGAEFVNRVVQQHGIEYLNRVWIGPEDLPTEQEIREPELWAQRIAVSA